MLNLFNRVEARRLARVFFSRVPVAVGLVVVVVFALTAAFAPWLTPYDPYEQDLTNVAAKPSAEHPLGTDSLGRDTLSRLIHGTRITLAVGVISVTIGAVVGSVLGLVAGFFGGLVSVVIMRFTDALMSLPPLLLSLVVAAMLGGGVTNVMIAVGIGLMPTYIRLLYGQTLSVKENEYVLAARATGVSKVAIMGRHVLPNCLSPLIVQATMSIGSAVLIEASLSFLGLGIAPPAAAWGAMVFDGYRYLTSHPVLAFAPGLALMLVVFAFMMVGDGLRDALDPRLRGAL